MAQEENLAIVRQLFACWNDRDLEGLDALVAPDVVYVNAPSAVEPGVRRGAGALAEVYRKQWHGLSEGRAEPVELAADGDRVFVVVKVSVTYGGSTSVAQQFGAVYTFRDGIIVHVELFDDVESARQAFAAG